MNKNSIKKDVIYGIVIVCMIIYMLVAALHGCIREDRIKSSILHSDSINASRINEIVFKIDSSNWVLFKRDSMIIAKIKDSKKTVAITKKRYEDNSKRMPVLPDF